MGLNRRNGTLMVALLAALAGCGDGGENVTRSTKSLSGRVESTGSFQGAVVDAHEVSSDGSEVASSNADGEGTIAANGEYSVDVDVEQGATATVLVEATKNGERLAAIVESDFSGSGTITVEPMTVETTFESDVYVRALAEGALCDGCSSALVLDWVGEAAAETHADASSEASLDAAVDVTADASAAFHAALESSAASEASLRTALEAQADARIIRAESLDASASASASAEAEGDYLDAVVTAYASAGIDIDEQAAAAQAAAERAQARIDATASLSAEMRASLKADIEVQRAVLVSWAVEAHAEASGASEATLHTAAETLKASLAAAATAGASADAQIEAAWDAYRLSVRASLRASLSAGEQTAFDAIVPVLEAAAATMHTSLDASYSVSGSVSTWIGPVLTFSASGDAQADALVAAGVSEARASVIVKMLVAAELAGG
jgi:hypothetical protein